MPRITDPEAGFVMTANNVITDSDEPYISYSFSHPFRAERLRQCLAGPGRRTAGELAALQSDMVSWAAQRWSRLLGRLEPLPSEQAEQARLMLAGWDGELRGDSPAALLYGCFKRALAEALYRPLVGDDTWRWLVSGELAVTDTLIRRWLANDTWELLGGPTGTAPEAARGERVLGVLPAALAAAWTQAAATGGGQGDWRWADHHQASAVPLLAGQRAPAPVGMGGDADTVQASAHDWQQGAPFDVTLLSVYRQVVDMADPGGASFVIPGGASGDPGSPHFADQLAQWAAGRRVPMLSLWPDIEAAATATTTLRPG